MSEAAPSPATSDPFPHSPEELTVAWLSAALGAEVESFRHEAMAVDGLSSHFFRIFLEYRDSASSAPKTVVAKFASRNSAVAQRFQTFGMYEREVQFYERFGKDAGISVPVCYAAHVDGAACALLLEDMSACQPCERDTHDVSDIETAVRHLARFHARHWNEAPVPQHHFWHTLSANSTKRDRTKTVVAGAVARVAERYASSPAATKLVELSKRWLSVWDDWYAPHADDVTLCHGDFHAGQVFFPSTADGRLAVFDWQTVVYGSGTSDLARLLMSSLGTLQRREHEGRLRRIYYDELVSHGVTNYSFHRFERRYRQNILWNLVTNFIGSLIFDPVYIAAQGYTPEQLEDIFFGRLLAQMEDNRVSSILSHGPDWELYQSLRPRAMSNPPAPRPSASPPPA